MIPDYIPNDSIVKKVPGSTTSDEFVKVLFKENMGWIRKTYLTPALPTFDKPDQTEQVAATALSECNEEGIESIKNSAILSEEMGRELPEVKIEQPSSLTSLPDPNSPSNSCGEHADLCLNCGEPGELLCCDTCPSAFHTSCLNLSSIPEGAWHCDICMGLATSEDFSKRRYEFRLRHRNELFQDSELDSSNSDSGDASDALRQCAMCHQEEDDLEAGAKPRKGRKMIGPWLDLEDREIWLHRECALWSPRVFYDEKRGFQNVENEVNRAGDLYCSFCRKRGAALGCYVPECHRTYHVPCARLELCLLLKKVIISHYIMVRRHRGEDIEGEEAIE